MVLVLRIYLLDAQTEEMEVRLRIGEGPKLGEVKVYISVPERLNLNAQ